MNFRSEKSRLKSTFERQGCPKGKVFGGPAESARSVGTIGGSRNEDLEEDLDWSSYFDTPFSPTRGAADLIAYAHSAWPGL